MMKVILFLPCFEKEIILTLKHQFVAVKAKSFAKLFLLNSEPYHQKKHEKCLTVKIFAIYKDFLYFNFELDRKHHE